MKKAFTLIELLIVVAIIAILAAIAVPNFLEAQTRAKVSRVKSDLRTSATALESYYVDNNTYPRCHIYGIAGSNQGWDPSVAVGNPFNNAGILEWLSTPIAYVTSALTRDVFKLSKRNAQATAAQMNEGNADVVDPVNDAAARLNSYIYQSWNAEDRTAVDTASTIGKPVAWLLHSAGPDQTYQNLGGVLALDRDVSGTINLMYDPTNGTISYGSVYRSGGMSFGTGNTGYAAGSALVDAINKSAK